MRVVCGETYGSSRGGIAPSRGFNKTGISGIFDVKIDHALPGIRIRIVDPETHT
jgi:hypothetical protein